MSDFHASYLTDIARSFRQYKKLADAALAQVSDVDLHTKIDPDANSIAMLLAHLSGNLKSRFTDFLTSDGEKADRDRDAEFEVSAEVPRAQLLAWWEDGWAIALASIDRLAPGDLERTVTIRDEAFVVVEALNRLVAHTAYHVGQIVLLAKHHAGAGWTTLSIPRGQSRQFARGTFKSGIIPPRR